ncbi:hypothetical protein [Aureivirga marina]|uniref:hypothetical protein n=1 Tax=Aureivirga marina TaxID=1182451 RepID=UPI0018CBC2C4|nr:hypothetical protein [Aureivirga marina]
MKNIFNFIIALIASSTIVAQEQAPPTPPDGYPEPIVLPPHLPIDSNILILVIAAVGLGAYTIYKKKLKLQ